MVEIQTLVIYNMKNEPIVAYIFFGNEEGLAREVAQCVAEKVPYAVFEGDITATSDLAITKLNRWQN